MSINGFTEIFYEHRDAKIRHADGVQDVEVRFKQ